MIVMNATTPEAVLDVTPLSGSIGAELRGTELRGPLDDSVIVAIRQALIDFKVIFFPDQHLTSDEHTAFARQFGQVTNGHPVLPAVGDNPDVLEIDYTKVRLLARFSKDAEATTNAWHTDVTFVETPPLGTVLNAITIPEAGGDTVFADTQAAYDALSEPFKSFLRTLRAVHDGRSQYQGMLERLGRGEWDGEAITALPPVAHPLVRTHPESGRHGLFVNPGFTDHIEGLSPAESKAILNYLYEHMTRQEFLVRYRWKAGDLGFWDNRSTMHYAVFDYGTAHRVIQRVTLRGDRPY